MAGGVNGDDPERTRQFRNAALPHLDEVYTLARYLLRNAADADDAVQECYLRALRHFDGFRGGPIRPWLMAILRNVCHAEFARRNAAAVPDMGTPDAAEPLWQEPAGTPETGLLRHHDAETIRRLVVELPEPFRETIVLREINNLSYRDIAEIVGAPVGTVMSRLARARAMLRTAWLALECEEQPK
jgi:RNA polymerase sigma-70 factor (ECF subfamily)